jgi:hypothetical protein
MDSVLALRIGVVVCGAGAIVGSGARAQAAVSGLYLGAFGTVISTDDFDGADSFRHVLGCGGAKHRLAKRVAACLSRLQRVVPA